jgi:hypothetical protein
VVIYIFMDVPFKKPELVQPTTPQIRAPVSEPLQVHIMPRGHLFIGTGALYLSQPAAGWNRSGFKGTG